MTVFGPSNLAQELLAGFLLVGFMQRGCIFSSIYKQWLTCCCYRMDTATYAAAAVLPWTVIQRLKRPCGPEAGISAIQAATEQNSKAFRANFRKHGLAPNRTPTVLRASQQHQMKGDLTVSGFLFALVLVGVILAANTEQPVFWLLIGPCCGPAHHEDVPATGAEAG